MRTCCDTNEGYFESMKYQITVREIDQFYKELNQTITQVGNSREIILGHLNARIEKKGKITK